MATRRTMLEEELAPGFSTLPGGGLMYQVATDYPKQMANILAEYEARAASPRYNPFGESPDSSRRLEAELTEPFRNVLAASQPQTRVSPPRYFETGGDIVQVDPATGRARTVFDTPDRNPPAEQQKKIQASLLTSEIRNLQRAKLLGADEKLMSGLTDEAIDAELGDRMTKLNALFQPMSQPTVAAPVSQPKMAFGGLSSELAPVLSSPSGTIQVGATNAPAAQKYKVRVIR